MTRRIEGSMIDTETLSLGPKALIWEVALIPFRINILDDSVYWEATGKPYHAMVDYSGMSTRDFDIDMQTIHWTGRQRRNDAGWHYWREKHFNPDADLRAMDRPGVAFMKPEDILFNLNWMTRDKPVWFRNSAFDVPTIENLAKISGREMPWHRRQQSDLYTQVNMAQQLVGYEDALPATAEHSAMNDALGQIEQLTDISGKIFGQNRPEPVLHQDAPDAGGL